MNTRRAHDKLIITPLSAQGSTERGRRQRAELKTGLQLAWLLGFQSLLVHTRIQLLLAGLCISHNIKTTSVSIHFLPVK